MTVKFMLYVWRIMLSIYHMHDLSCRMDILSESNGVQLHQKRKKYTMDRRLAHLSYLPYSAVRPACPVNTGKKIKHLNNII